MDLRIDIEMKLQLRNCCSSFLSSDIRIVAGHGFEPPGSLWFFGSPTIQSGTFETIEIQGNEARISVRFRSKMISCTKDKSGAVIEGSADQVVDIQDVWTFARDTNGANHDWILEETDEG